MSAPSPPSPPSPEEFSKWVFRYNEWEDRMKSEIRDEVLQNTVFSYMFKWMSAGERPATVDSGNQFMVAAAEGFDLIQPILIVKDLSPEAFFPLAAAVGIE